MKKWLLGVGLSGLLLGCGTTEASDNNSSDDIPPMFNLRVETCGITYDGKEDCHTFSRAVWGDLADAEDNLEFRLERLGRPVDGKPQNAKYLLVLTTNGCVADNPSPIQSHDIVVSELFFNTNPQKASANWEVTLNPVEPDFMPGYLVNKARQKARLTLQHGEGLTHTTRECHLWERRESALHSIGYNQENVHQD